ncbi:uncharacterized protein LOC114362570, partial [Ostrinia furnacalis]|uniref:uncharacterized protein LOC114362570 n=1 Tax=Ostrinia furnacalis TaxID=93504 RepID=UPI001039D11D
MAARGVYCVGSFELAPDEPSPLYQLMQLHSSNWVDNFNHTRLHRGLCVSRRCELDDEHQPMDAWFASCVNASTMSAYNLSARLYHLEYCERGAGPAPAPPLTTSERAFAGVLATLLALAAVSTGLDLTLTDHAKKSMSWALSWSLRGSWRALCAAPPSTGVDLQALDGLRVLGLLCFVIEHVCWLNTLTYIVNTRHVEKLPSARVDLQALDGLRVLGLLCFVIEHVCWLNTLTYIVNTRHVEKLPSTGVDLQALDGLRVLGLLCFVIEHVCWLNTLTYIVNTHHVKQ